MHSTACATAVASFQLADLEPVPAGVMQRLAPRLRAEQRLLAGEAGRQHGKGRGGGGLPRRWG